MSRTGGGGHLIPPGTGWGLPGRRKESHGLGSRGQGPPFLPPWLSGLPGVGQSAQISYESGWFGAGEAVHASPRPSPGVPGRSSQGNLPGAPKLSSLAEGKIGDPLNNCVARAHPPLETHTPHSRFSLGRVVKIVCACARARVCVGGGERLSGFFLQRVGLEITRSSDVDYLVQGDRPGLGVSYPGK